MTSARLTTALNENALDLPDGEIAVLRPDTTYDLSDLAPRKPHIVHSLRPDMDHWEAMGHPVSRDLPKVAAAIVVLPRSKALARAMVAQAAACADLVIVDGAKTYGIDSIYKECRKRLGDVSSLSKAHGRIFWFAGTDAFADWAGAAPAKADHGYFTTAGVYSDGSIDKGSALLAATLPKKFPKRMADFGAGWGYLSEAVLANPNVESIELIEAEALALDCARLNVTDPRASFTWADVTNFKPAAPYGGIIMNPPFHTGRAAEPALGQAFIAAAARNLTPSGQLWMVANRHLPYEAALDEHFRHFQEIGGSGAFKLFHAIRPKR